MAHCPLELGFAKECKLFLLDPLEIGLKVSVVSNHQKLSASADPIGSRDKNSGVNFDCPCGATVSSYLVFLPDQGGRLILESADTISNLLKIPRSRVYELCRLDLIPHARIGKRHYRFDRSAIEEWIRAGGTKNTSQKEQSAVPINNLA